MCHLKIWDYLETYEGTSFDQLCRTIEPSEFSKVGIMQKDWLETRGRIRVVIITVSSDIVTLAENCHIC